MESNSKVLIFILVILMATLSCSKKSKNPSGPSHTIDEKIEQTDNGIKQTIAPYKDSEVEIENEVSISIPGGAVSEKDFPEGLTVSVERINVDSPEDVGAIAVEVQPLSPVYHIDAGDASFTKPVTVRIPVSNIAKPDKATFGDLQIVTWNDSLLDYENLETALSSDGEYLEANVTHLSYFAVKLKAGTEFYGKFDMSLHIGQKDHNLVFDNVYSNLEMNDWKALAYAISMANGYPWSIWINYQVEVYKDGFKNDALATIQMYRVVWYSSKYYDAEWKTNFTKLAGDLYGKSAYTVKEKKEIFTQQFDATVGMEKIIIYDQYENPIPEKETSYTFSPENPFDKFLNEVFWSDASKQFCPVSVLSDPNGKYFIKVSRAYPDGQIGGGNTATSAYFTPYDIPPVVTLSEPAAFAKVTTFTPEFAWDGVSVADVSVNYEIRLSARNSDPVKSPEITKQVGSVERFFNSSGSGQITLEQLPYYWCVRAYTIKDSKQVAEAFSDVKSFEVVGPDTYTVSGRILLNGAGLSGVSVNLKGTDTDKTVTTGSDGTFTFTCVFGGSYTVTPTLTGYTFNLPNQSVSVYASTTVPDIIATKTDSSGGETTTYKNITFVTIPAGTFRMGDVENYGQYSREKPVHSVTLSSFEMSIYEITQGQYQSVMGTNPSYFKSGDNYPVERVSWFDAVKFCNKLSDAVGLDRCYNESTWECDFSVDGFRLPTEAEWEYACRAGTETEYYTGNNESDLSRAGWWEKNSEDITHAVGHKEPNTWGIFDMPGNVYEWCHDWYESDYYSSSPTTNPFGPSSGSSRVMRGCGYTSYASACRSAFRSYWEPYKTESFVGFRIVCRP